MLSQPTIAEFQNVYNSNALRDHLLGVQWFDEPNSIPLNQQQNYYNQFQAYRQQVHGVFPDLPVFVNNAPAFVNGAQESQWWTTWTNSGEVTSQDNYPILPTTTSIGKNNSPPGISESISRATYATNQQKPVWAIVGAFESTAPDNSSFPFRFPTPTQLRAQVYTALIHGATGIVYFAWDSYITRGAGLNGISPNPQAAGYLPNNPGGDVSATAQQVQQSLQLWNTTTRINGELAELAPAILSPTLASSELSYSVQLSNLSAPDNTSLYSNTPIRTLLKKDQSGNYILLAVNMDSRSMDATFDFSKSFNGFGLMFEDDGALASLHGVHQFTFHFTPFDTNVFVLTSIPEPSALCLIIIGLCGLTSMVRYRTWWGGRRC